jgi:hypothetical protein
MSMSEGSAAPASGPDPQADESAPASASGIPDFATLAADPEIAALLDFVPVPRKIEVEDGWGPDKQREFIARLAVHGSKNKACTEVGKCATGMTKVQNSPGAKSFREAWRGAVDLARSRRAEMAADEIVRPGERLPTIDHRIKHGRYAAPSPQGLSRLGGAGQQEGCPHCGEGGEIAEWRRHKREREEQLSRVRRSLFMARRVYLLSIADDPERRAAWELLCGPADWDAAAAMKAQRDENPGSADMTPLREATLQVPLKTGFLPRFTDPEWNEDSDPLPQLEQSVLRHDPRGRRSAEPGEGDGESTESKTNDRDRSVGLDGRATQAPDASA